MILFALAWAGTATGLDGALTVDAPARIVSLGGGLTEIVYALGAESQLVAVDASSLYPEAATALPQVGYYRQIGAEGVLSVRPDLVIAAEESGPPQAMGQLTAAGVPVLRLTGAPTADAARTRIRAIAAILDRGPRGEALIAALDADLAAVHPPTPPPKVAFLFGRGAGSLTLAGTDTAANAIIALAGGRNAVTGFTGYQPLSAEALVVAAPDVVLTTTGIAAAMGGRDALLAHPAIAASPAGQQQRLIILDDLLLLGFGPRTGQAARQLAEALR